MRCQICSGKCLDFQTVEGKTKALIFKGPDGRRYKQDSNMSDGYKFSILIFITIPKGLVAFGHRIGDFTRLGSFQRAAFYSKVSCKKLDFKQLHSESRKAHFIALRKLGVYSYNFIAEPAKDLIKTGTFPIHILSLNVIAILGVVFPKTGRYFFSKVQRLWEYDNVLERERFASTGEKPFWFNSSCIHYVAPCMQPLEDCNRLNFTMYLPWSNPRELRSLWSRFDHLVNRYEDLFVEEVHGLQESIRDLKSEITRIYPRGGRETDKKGDLRRDGFNDARSDFEALIASFEKMVEEGSEKKQENFESCIGKLQELKKLLKCASHPIFS